jgi:hypothetical protein
MEVFADIEQGSPEWLEMRKGLPTASNFHKVMAKAGPKGGTSHKEYVQRTRYMRVLAGELLTGELQEADWEGNRHTERGKEREDEARLLYALDHGIEPVQVGFVKNGNCGCSPDSFVGDDGGLEIKDAVASTQIERLTNGTLPNEHKWQVLGELLVCERDYWDFMSHCRGLPPLYIRTRRDDVKDELQALRDGIDKFCAERDMLIKWIRAMS